MKSNKLLILLICLIVFSSSQLTLINDLPNLQDQNKSIKIVNQEQPIRIMGDPNPGTH